MPLSRLQESRTAFDIADYSSGERTSQIIELPDGYNIFRLWTSREGWELTSQRLLKTRVFITYDRGITWETLFGYTAAGNNLTARQMEIARSIHGDDFNTYSGMFFATTHREDVTNRWLRVNMITTRPLRTHVVVDFERRALDHHTRRPPESVAFDAVSSGGPFAGIISMTWAHTPAGSPSAIGIGIGSIQASGGDLNSIASVTYGGVSCAPAVTRSADHTPGLFVRGSIYGLGSGSMPSGTQDISITWDTSGQYGGAGAISVTGSDPSTLFSATGVNSNGGGVLPDTTISVASDELTMDTVAVVSGGALSVGAPTSGQTSRWDLAYGANNGFTGSTKPGTSGGQMSWPNISTAAAQTWIHCVAAFKVAGGAPASQIKTLDGLDKASIKTYDGTDMASVKTVDGLA